MSGGDKHLSPRETVKINVGGKLYEASLSLIEQNPASMLQRLVSDTWCNKDAAEPIFIDRDGDIFAHVLNYLRYGSIDLPHTIPKSMFFRELDYYGVTIEDECIKQITSIETMKRIKQRIHDAELHHDMLLIAANCYLQFMSGRTTLEVRNGDIDLKHSPYFYDENTAMCILNGYLDMFYGLKASQQQKLFASDLDFVLKVEEVSVSSGAEFDDNQEPTKKESSLRFSGDASLDELIGSFECDDVSSSLSGTMQVSPLRGKGGRVLTEGHFIGSLGRWLRTP
mmetsp:Transcript_32490/g.68134  ORF Transcript_32490/g.68134 Transcript_32490/m.68134 type:complete len:282 (+) Transcript_32490:167-1012(+)